MMARLLRGMSKCNEKELQGEEAAMVLRQSTVGNPPMCKDVRMYFYYDKPGHIAQFSAKQRTKIGRVPKM